ncbi:MAG: divergent polysaccharide deacetylase family protein [Rhodospirillum sp.]|nr:divergent polysaccharide deacetylase family protein [Rhodospirillum sp.]MCF8488422.1 divergent polysaccharide deacetylase family protein [Rhodospirillum sp.]MCF8503174.1 divergent polysaccharide deacetylase family protein [Rhodospirillum sp.]
MVLAAATLAIGLGVGLTLGLQFGGKETVAPKGVVTDGRGVGSVDPGSTANLKGYPGRPDNPNQYKPPPLPRPGLPPPLKPLAEQRARPDPLAPRPLPPQIRDGGEPLAIREGAAPVQSAALPKEFQDLLRGDGPGYVMEEKLPEDTYVHEPEKAAPVALPEDLSFPEADHDTANPPWKRYALVVPPAVGPVVAVVIDDLGLDRKRTAKTRDLPGPLTLAYLAYAQDLADQMRAGRRAGHEILMHMPMEPLNSKINPGPDALGVGLSDDEILARLRRNLDKGAEFVGINNHMGSRFTADTRGMSLVMGELRKRGLLWLDSMTAANSVGLPIAAMADVPRVGRNVFLDNLPDKAAVLRQLARLEEAAKAHGMAVGIGHPKDATIAALRVWLPSLRRKGITLVPISTLVETGGGSLVGRL